MPGALFPRGMRLLAVLGLLAGCALPQAPDAPLPEPSGGTARALPAMRTFGAPRPQAPQRSNTEIARDFLDLSFKLESGVTLPVMSRFETPVTVALTGRITPIFELELDRLVARLRSEAGLDIRRAPNGSPDASITIEAITRAQLQRVVPSAACFVLPQRIIWDEFRRNTRRRDLNWADLRVRQAASIFIPHDVSAQEIRDCLHEETAQALGPVNDLYRLEDSVFNDDNMHSVLTGFDMVILRTTYDGALHSGMDRASVANALPAILARTNPGGGRFATRPYQPSPRAWVDEIETALSPGRRGGARRQSALRALDIAQSEGWGDVRAGLSYLTVGRLAAAGRSELALDAFIAAADIYDARSATAIHAANTGIQLAAFAISAGEMDLALRLADKHIPAARQAEDAALLADLLLVRATALDTLGRSEEAALARQESLGWGRYGFRSDAALRRRAQEIAALVPRNGEGS